MISCMTSLAGKLLVFMALWSLCACASSSNKGAEELGYWVDEKPYRGTLDKNKFHVRPYWQCVEPFIPHKNKEC